MPPAGIAEDPDLPLIAGTTERHLVAFATIFEETPPPLLREDWEGFA